MFAEQCGCPTCKERERNRVVQTEYGKRRRCDACGGPIPLYPSHDGQGFEARSVDHWKCVTEGGHNFHMAVRCELCLPCYQADQIANGEPPLNEPPYVGVKHEETVCVQDFIDCASR